MSNERVKISDWEYGRPMNMEGHQRCCCWEETGVKFFIGDVEVQVTKASNPPPNWKEKDPGRYLRRVESTARFLIDVAASLSLHTYLDPREEDDPPTLCDISGCEEEAIIQTGNSQWAVVLCRGHAHGTSLHSHKDAPLGEGESYTGIHVLCSGCGWQGEGYADKCPKCGQGTHDAVFL